MDIEKIGKFIKELRQENNMSQNQLSEEIHVTRQAISNWENGKSLPDSNILLILSKMFNVSINEILSGEKHTDNNNLEDITLKLIDDNNMKRRKIKKTAISLSIVIFTLLFILFGYYFFTNYNSIKVYKISGKSESFKTAKGIFVTTRNKSYLRLGEIIQYDGKEEKVIKKVSLYYIDSNKKKVKIYERENDTNVLIQENEDYTEFPMSKKREQIINNLYLKIEYNEGTEEIIKLIFDETFKNSFDYFKKQTNLTVIKDSINPQIIIKQSDKINEIISYEEKRLNELSEIRKEENKEIEDNNYEEPKQEYNNYIEVLYEEPVKEDNNNKVEIIQDEQIVEEETEIVEESNEIDYDLLVEKLKEKGINQGGGYSYDFIIDEKYYSINYYLKTLTIDIIYENIMNNVVIYIDSSYYVYMSFINNSLDNYNEGNINDNVEVKKIINDIYVEITS